MTPRRCPSFALLAAALWLAGSPANADAETLADAIRRAGNAEDDSARLAVLTGLQARGDLDAAFKADLNKMIAEVRLWITSKRLDYFARPISQKLDYDFGLSAGSPLEPLARLYRGRMLVWVTLESGNIQRYPDRRRRYLDKAVADFQAAGAAFGDNRIVGMYLGRPIPPARTYAAPPGAPAWAAAQREGIERLADIIEWWIDRRMQADAQYGGGWGDDCEMWRWWVPVLIGFHEPKIAAAQGRFSAALMGQSHMAGGYTSRMTDVEHTAEDSADVITPMMHLAPEEPTWNARARRLAELMGKLWTGRNERGLLQFKSTYFTVDKVDETSQRACDTVYHPRAIQPALLLWQRTADAALGELIADWMRTWVDAAANAQRGKPAGVLPSAIHWPDGRVGGEGADWFDPRNHGEPTLYLWPSAMPMMLDTLLLTWHMTGEERYLQPLRTMAAIRLKYLRGPPADKPAAGGEAWCAAQMKFLAPTLAKYKRLSGSGEFDELLGRDYRGLDASDPAGRKTLTAALQANAEALGLNFAGYTSEVRYTDRVLRFPTLFEPDMMFAAPPRRVPKPRPDLLYSTVTGDAGEAGYFPLNAVRWLTPPRDIAALVTDTGSDRLTAELYHFGPDGRQMAAELYLLKPGRYSLELSAEGAAQTATASQFTVTGPRTRVSLVLPSRRLCTLRVRPAS